MIRKWSLLTITITALTLTPFCHSQNQKLSLASDIEVAKAQIRVEKSTIISAAMNFSDKDAAVFWPIY